MRLIKHHTRKKLITRLRTNLINILNNYRTQILMPVAKVTVSHELEKVSISYVIST